MKGTGASVAEAHDIVMSSACRRALHQVRFFGCVAMAIEESRAMTAQLLTPVNSLHRAVDELGNALRAAGPDPASREIVQLRCAAVAALAARLATEGTPVFPDTIPEGGR
jgi:hypothetical protein